MNLPPFDPRDEMRALHHRLNDVFEEAFGGGGEGRETPDWSPPVDIYETDTSVVVRAELPGMNREEINVQLEGDTLTLSGTRVHTGGEDENGHRSECPRGRYRRAFTLGMPVDASRISATYIHGVLEVRLPKPAPARPRQISIETE